MIGSRQQLWREKTSRAAKWVNEAAVAWGTTLEPVAKLYHEAEQGVIVVPSGFVVHPDIDWLGGSPDGLIDGRGMSEYKCPYSQKVWDEPPEYYIPQVQGLLEILDRDWCHFVCWTPKEVATWKIERSQEYWDWMLPKLCEFWAYVECDIEPPPFARGQRYRFSGDMKIERIS